MLHDLPGRLRNTPAGCRRTSSRSRIAQSVSSRSSPARRTTSSSSESAIVFGANPHSSSPRDPARPVALLPERSCAVRRNFISASFPSSTTRALFYRVNRRRASHRALHRLRGGHQIATDRLTGNRDRSRCPRRFHLHPLQFIRDVGMQGHDLHIGGLMFKHVFELPQRPLVSTARPRRLSFPSLRAACTASVNLSDAHVGIPEGLPVTVRHLVKAGRSRRTSRSFAGLAPFLRASSGGG